jgi:hypothetical protein
MSAVELFLQDGRGAGVWYCSECRVVHLREQEATACHGQLICKTEGCGKEVSPHRRHVGLCDDCENKAWREKCAKEGLERYQIAEKVAESDYAGPVYADGIGSEWFESLEDFRECYADEDKQNLEYVWSAKDVGVIGATSEDVTERLLDEMWEGADESDLNGVPELEAAITAFNKANEAVTVWHVDYSKAIILTKAPSQETGTDEKAKHLALRGLS